MDTTSDKGEGSQEEEAHPIQGMAAVHGAIQAAIHQEEVPDQEEAVGQEEDRCHLHHHRPHQEEGVQEEAQDQVPCQKQLHHSSQEEEQVDPGSTPPPGITQPPRSSDPWGPLDRSRKALPKLMLPSNYKACSILEMRQLLESWYDRCTFAIATWRGDAQRYWLDQILDLARARHDQWLQSTPSQRASLEPAYILGDRKEHSRGKECGFEGVLRTELLDAIPKSIAESCMRTWILHSKSLLYGM